MTVYIVCSGPSLEFFDFEKLRGKDCIAVNFSVFDVPEIVALVARDSNFYEMCHEHLKGCEFPIYAVEGHHPTPIKQDLGVIELKNAGWSGVELGEGVRHGMNSGYTAIGVAIKMGYTDIRVLGMDLTNDGHYWKKEKTFNLNYVIEHLHAMKDELPEGINITFYGPTKAKMFDNKPLEEWNTEQT